MSQDAWQRIISIISGSNFFKKKKENVNDEYFTFRPWDMMSTNILTWPNGTQELRGPSNAIRK
jgi:hypothetical protein